MTQSASRRDTPRFHLVEIASDIRSTIRDLSELRNRVSTLASEPNGPWDRRILLAVDTIVATLEHDLEHHVPAILALAGREVSHRSEITIPPVASGAETLIRIDNLMKALGHAEVLVQSLLEVFRADASAARSIEELHEHLAETTLPLAVAIQRDALALKYAVEPAAALEDTIGSALETPLRTEFNPEAKRLARCPRCGGSLSDEDRTFSGSYCETCRTRWEESRDGAAES